MDGYRINGNYSSLTVWEFCSATRQLISTFKSRPNPGMPRKQRYRVLKAELEKFGIRPPSYVQSKKEARAKKA